MKKITKLLLLFLLFDEHNNIHMYYNVHRMYIIAKLNHIIKGSDHRFRAWT